MKGFYSSTFGSRDLTRYTSQSVVKVEQYSKTHDPNALLKKAIWTYFILLIFEGALRKWFLPGLSTPLLIIRDPLAIWLVLSCWYRGLLPSNMFLSVMVVIGITGVFTATFLGHGSLPVAIYGARVFLFHFPLIFVIGRIFKREDVLNIGIVMLWMSIPMTLLIALQFLSPQSAWVNQGVGGNVEGAGFDGALGYYRPPGTFSFTNGNTLFYSFLAVFVIYFWIGKAVNRILLIGATIALLVAIPLSISRGLFYQVCLSLVFALIGVFRKPKYLSRIIFAIVGAIIIIVLLSQTSIFQTATGAFSARFEGASKTEGGIEGTLVDRFLGGMVGALKSSSEHPFFGYGLGMGTNVGSMLLVGGRVFLIAEEEWGRVIGELGPLMGLSVIFVRLYLCVKLTVASYFKLITGDFLPWILLSFGVLLLAQGNWAQPTSLGFFTLLGGLMVASLRD